jgi:hypothetical protein
LQNRKDSLSLNGREQFNSLAYLWLPAHLTACALIVAKTRNFAWNIHFWIPLYFSNNLWNLDDFREKIGRWFPGFGRKSGDGPQDSVKFSVRILLFCIKFLKVFERFANKVPYSKSSERRFTGASCDSGKKICRSILSNITKGSS